MQKLYQLNKREKSLIFVLLIAAFFLAGWHVNGKTILSELSSAMKTQKLLSEERDYMQTMTGERDLTEKEWLSAKNSRERLDKVLPELSALPGALKLMESILTEPAININSLIIGDTIYQERYAAVPITIKVCSTQLQLQRLLKKLDQLPQLITFQRLSWQNRPGQNPELELHMQLLFYVRGDQVYYEEREL